MLYIHFRTQWIFLRFYLNIILYFPALVKLIPVFQKHNKKLKVL